MNVVRSMSREVCVPDSVVPYERFLEVRQRRQGVLIVTTPSPGPPRSEDPVEGESVTMDCEILTDRRGEAPTKTAAIVRPKNPSI